MMADSTTIDRLAIEVMADRFRLGLECLILIDEGDYELWFWRLPKIESAVPA